MPFGTEGVEPGIGLALSGGGFRAMLFHLGALWRLNELGLLAEAKRISGVSGGSLLLGRLGHRWSALDFQSGIAMRFEAEVAEPILRFATRSVDVPAVLKGLLPFQSAADAAARAYAEHLVDESTLQNLPASPRIVLNAAHLASGVNWRFSKPYMGCYRIGLYPEPTTSLATAMAASAAFPPVLSPLTLELDATRFQRTEGADLYDRVELRRTVRLTDGGVYDNLGLETVWSRFETVLASDAGGGLEVDGGRFWNPVTQLKRTLDIAVEQGRALRRVGLIADIKAGTRTGAIWMTSTKLAHYPAASPFPVDPGWRHFLAAIRTRLNPFTESERAWLVNWGYLVSDVAIRSWVRRDAPPPQRLPFPRFGFAEPPPGAPPDLAGRSD